MSKIKFDLSQLDRDGLVGPIEGKRSLAFEFCIPDDASRRQVIMNIDSTIRFSRSPGRIPCLDAELLCLGETKANYKDVFASISKLDFVHSIVQTYFE